MSDLTTFNPETVDQLLDRIIEDVTKVGEDWLNENAGVVDGYFKSLVEAAMQTKSSLAAGKITAEYADQVLHMQQAAFRQTIKYTKYMSLVLSQKVVDAVFSVIAHVVKNKTGFDLFPEYTSK